MNFVHQRPADASSVRLAQRSSFAFELAQQPDGYLCPQGDMVADLCLANLVSVRVVADGFVIIKAIPIPLPPDRGVAKQRWWRAAGRESVAA